ncbi:MAG: endonuclease MutS2 [Hydrogenothermaceae bacterium]
MRERDLRNLEYDKFLALLAGFSQNQHTQDKIKKLRPYTNAKLLEEDKAKTQEFTDLVKEEGYFPLSEFPDISQSISLLTIQDSVLLPKDIYEIGKVLRVVKEVKNFLSEKDINHLKPILKNLYPLKEVEKIIFDSIDQTFTVKDSASFDLRRIRRQIRETEEKITSTLEKFINSKDVEEILQDRFVTIKRDRFVIPVKHNFVSRIKGIIQDRSSSGQTVFVEPLEVVNLNNRLLDLKLQESIEIRRILKFITDILRSKVEFIRKSFESICELDILYTKAKFSLKVNGKFPENSVYIKLNQAKHPIFLLKDKEFIPIDIDLIDKKGLLITGSNTGGKTVALKTLGLLSVLNQTAIPIPVDEGSTLPFFEGIFIDIGDSQSIEENLSTYSAHIKNIDEIIHSSNEKSLVLFDELIPGTDPDFAAPLGIAILERIQEIGSYVVATTHLKRVKLYGLNSQYFRLSAVGFDKETLQPTYQLIYDTVGESMAFYIAEKLGFDKKTLNKAKSIVDKNILNFEDIVNNLNKLIIEYYQKLKEVEESHLKLSQELQKYRELTQKLEKDRKEKWKESFRDIEEFLRNLREEGYKVIEKVKEEKSGKPLESFIKTKREQIGTILEEKSQDQFNEGDYVRLKGKSQKGTVISVRESRAKVDFGGLKVWVNLSDLEKVEKEDKNINVNVSVKKPTISPQINLIGKTKEEAIRELQDYIDKALLSGITTFKIIHGFGSGVLRKAVREFLDRQPFKVRYEDAPYNEGGLGATIVYLE